jgi:hypothetical protein
MYEPDVSYRASLAVERHVLHAVEPSNRLCSASEYKDVPELMLGTGWETTSAYIGV